jgi:peptidoglycan hydrolase-like protein with peptidoglycan-binding domain
MDKTQFLTGAAVAGLLAIAAAAPAMAFDASAMQAAAPHGGGLLLRVALQPYSLTYSPRNVQLLLQALGYDVGTPDGMIGAKSRTAIASFEATNGLPATGGQPSLQLFYALQKAVAQQGGAAMPQQQQGFAVTPSGGAASTETILNVQAKLRQRGYKVDSITGVLDSQTTAAIRTFQADNGMAMTGKIDSQLLSMLSQPGGAMPQGGSDMGSSDMGSSDTGGAMPSSQGTGANSMLQLEQGLAALGYNPGSVDGVYDASTKNAIKKFQTDYDMTPVNGQASGAVMAAVQSEVAGGGSTGSDMGSSDRGGSDTGGGMPAGGGDTTAGTPVPGNGGLDQEQGLLLEQTLSGMGYAVGPVDGVIDSKTQAGIKQYQTAKGMAATGAIDDALITALNADISAGTAGGTATGGGMPDNGGMTDNGGAGGMPMDGGPQVVMQIEQELKKKGYHVGAVDGQLDPFTQKAIDDFIRHTQLTIPDTPSQELLLAIQSSNMTAKKGAQQDLIKTGVDALGNLLSQ